ncbi:MAG: thioesterase family protein [Actinomycetota bacterium]|nr:thioesterase family protein [Actinomycetota bacterium]
MSRLPTLPTLGQAAALPLNLSFTVPPEFTDANGHMNIARYLELYSRAGWVAFSRVGLGEQTALAGGPATFDAEHYLRYAAEVHAGDEVTVHSRLVGRSDKAVHHVHLMLDRTTGTVASTFEAVSVSIDLTVRRPTPFPPEVAAALDAQLALDAALPWPPPLCGVLGVR